MTALALVRETTVTEEIRSALTAHVDACLAEPDLALRAQTALENLDHEVAHRREAINRLMHDLASSGPPDKIG